MRRTAAGGLPDAKVSHDRGPSFALESAVQQDRTAHEEVADPLIEDDGDHEGEWIATQVLASSDMARDEDGHLWWIIEVLGFAEPPEYMAPEQSAPSLRDQIGPVAAFKQAIVVDRLPKTRSGKILRGTMRRIADASPVNRASSVRSLRIKRSRRSFTSRRS